MSDTLGSLLSQREMFEPPEIARIKAFVSEQYQVTPLVGISGKQLVITVKGAALAGTLRMRLVELEKIAQTDKRLVIRIG
jgi:hypothetical protein